MSRIKFNLLVLMFVTNVSLSEAQTPINIGNKLSIYSKLLDEDREFWVSLPKSYNDTIYSQKSYPVCYFFDGDSHFENMVAQTNRLSKGLYASMPEIIMVGIIQKNRTNELTPTHMKTPKEWKRADFSTSGGNKRFMLSIENELKPYINKTYRTNGYNILIGHSFGGLAVINTFLKHPTNYNAYVAIDPSMWWDNKKLVTNINNIWNVKYHTNKSLFLAKADAAGSGGKHHEAILELNKKLSKLLGEKNTSYKYVFYKGENHGSVVVPAQYDAIRFIFDGYELPVKKVMKNPELIDEHYKAISKKMGYTIIPNEESIDKLAKVCKRQELFKQAKYLLHQNTLYYPDSKRAKEQYELFMRKN